MSRGRIVVVYGTRPEAIKLGPVVAELRALGCEPTLVCSGQHTDLLAGTPAETDLAGSCSLGLRSSGHVDEWMVHAVRPMMDAFESLKPIACVVVQGDTMSAHAAAFAARQLGLPIAHVEAGLRSHRLDEPWPEERIRKGITEMADWHYAPTERAAKNLAREGVRFRSILVTGNTVVSALARYAPEVQPTQFPAKHILITMHRREWSELGAFHVIQTIDALFEMAQEYPELTFLWPMHPGIQRAAGHPEWIAPENVRIVKPLPYSSMVYELARSLGVCTDSGGLQEEAGVLGVPCAVMRNVSDRPESIDAGTAKLFPPSPNGIRDAIRCLAGKSLPRTPISAFGAPDSAFRIASHLVKMS